MAKKAKAQSNHASPYEPRGPYHPFGDLRVSVRDWYDHVPYDDPVFGSPPIEAQRWEFADRVMPALSRLTAIMRVDRRDGLASMVENAVIKLAEASDRWCIAAATEPARSGQFWSEKQEAMSNWLSEGEGGKGDLPDTYHVCAQLARESYRASMELGDVLLEVESALVAAGETTGSFERIVPERRDSAPYPGSRAWKVIALLKKGNTPEQVASRLETDIRYVNTVKDKRYPHLLIGDSDDVSLTVTDELELLDS